MRKTWLGRALAQKRISRLFQLLRKRFTFLQPTITNLYDSDYSQNLPANLAGRGFILEWKDSQRVTASMLVLPGQVIPSEVMKAVTGDESARAFRVQQAGEIAPDCVELNGLNVAAFDLLGETPTGRGQVSDEEFNEILRYEADPRNY